jgi:hypothetical protein
VIADSEMPASRRADAALRKKLARAHVPILYTSDAGAISLRLHGAHWEVSAAQDGL